jgi:nucleotide-binding universal stress UspA family protein
MLVTLDVPVDPMAAEVGVDAAVEAGQPLLVVNVVETAFLPSTLANWDYVVRPDVEESLRRPSELAHSLGVKVERLRVRSPHPLDALLEVVAERAPGLLVFGPERERLSPRRYRKAAKTVSERAGCLCWLPS